VLRAVLVSVGCIFLLVSSSLAVDNNTSTNRTSFTCPPGETFCYCDGSYLDCKNMGDKVCKGGKVDPANCTRTFCSCEAKATQPIERITPDATVPMQQLQ